MKIDFNSLMILNAVTENGSASIAAKKLAISPSSVTYAINKLRNATGNPIFIRSKTGVKPTTLALELNRRYKKAVLMINDGVLNKEDSSLSDATKTLTISTYTFIELWISLRVLADKQHLPGTVLNFITHPATNDERLTKLRNREVDFDIGSQLPNDPSIVSYRLFNSDLKVMVKKNHPTIDDKLDQHDWLANKHVTWNRIHTDTSSMMGDAQILESMQKREVHIRSDSSLNMMLVSSQSNHLMLVPSYFCDFLEQILPVKFFYPPFANSMESSIFIHAHATSMKDDTMMQFLELLKSAPHTCFQDPEKINLLSR